MNVSIRKIITVQTIETCSDMTEQEASGFGLWLGEELHTKYPRAEIVVVIDDRQDSCSLHVECSSVCTFDDQRYAKAMVSDFIADCWDRWAY